LGAVSSNASRWFATSDKLKRIEENNHLKSNDEQPYADEID